MSKVELLHNIIESLRAVTAQEDKLAILKRYEKENLLRRIIHYGYNPWVDFKMQDFKPKHMGKKFGMGIAKFMHILDDIVANKLDQREAEFACRMAFIHIQDQEAHIMLDLLNGTFDVGLTIETINSVWPNLILAYPLRAVKSGTHKNYTQFPAGVQPVSRGLRVNIIINDGVGEIRNSKGEVLSQWSSLVDQFVILAQGQNTVFDGHAVVADGTNIVETNNEAVLAADLTNIRFMIWDVIRYDGFIQGKDTRIGYNWRYNGIEHMMMLAAGKIENPIYDVVRAELVGSQEQLDATVEKHNGQCIIKSLAGTWAHGESAEEIICGL